MVDSLSHLQRPAIFLPAVTSWEPMTKAESEKVIRHLCSVWAREREIPMPSSYPQMASFGAFTAWLDEKGYGHYLNFRSTMGPREDAERWFYQEFKQTWGN